MFDSAILSMLLTCSVLRLLCPKDIADYKFD